MTSSASPFSFLNPPISAHPTMTKISIILPKMIPQTQPTTLVMVLLHLIITNLTFMKTKEPHAKKKTPKTSTPRSLSFCFERFHLDWRAADLGRMFSNFGKVLKVYVPNKLNRRQWKFGFVHFEATINKGLLLQDLNSIWIGTYKMRVNMESYRKK